MKNDAIIRPYMPDDYNDVKQNLIEGEMFYEDIYDEVKMKDKITKDPQSILVAEVQGVAVGNVYLVTDWGPLVFGLAVRKSYRRQGIGKKLIDEVRKVAKSKGFPEIHLLVHESKDQLQTMYETWGFIKTNPYRWMTSKT